MVGSSRDSTTVEGPARAAKETIEAPPGVRVFLSSPGDVAEERLLARRVIERLQGEFAGRASLESVFWEHEPLRATGSWHEQVFPPSEADIVLCVLWSRLGTRQPAEVTRPDGSRYDSGTEYEFEEAWRAYRERGRPDLLVYRKMREPRVSLKDKVELMDRLAQKEALDRFMETWFEDREEGALIAAYHPFKTPDDFEELVEVHLRKLLEERLPSAGARARERVKVWREGSPFRGLEVFEFSHARVFCGRTKATSEVLDALREQSGQGRPFVLVLGMSGCGKSSLVRAGVLPLLTQPGVIEGVGLWRWAVLRPGDAGSEVFAALASALLEEGALPELGADGTGVEALARLLEESPEAAFALIKGGLSQAASEVARAEGLESQPQARLALVVDQLEELFTTAGVTAEAREGFIAALESLVASGRVWVLATLRSDFYPRCAELPGLVRLKEGTGQYDLLPPTAAEIGQMIRRPAQLAALSFEEVETTGERLDDVLRDAAARNPEALPLLQFTLEELYTARRDGELVLSAYEELGGVEGALAQRAEAAFGALSEEVQAAFPVVMSALVTVGVGKGDGGMRQRAPLAAFEEGSPGRELVERFVAARLLVSDRDDRGRAVVAVAHEALLAHWPRLAEWLEHNRELLRMRDRLDAAAREWEAEGRPAASLLASGKRLAEAEELEAARGIELPEREHVFLQASLARGRRMEWLKRAAVAALVVLTVAAGAGAWVANQKRAEAEVARGESEAVTGFLSDMLASVDPEELGREVLVKDVMDEASKSIDDLADQPLIQARLMTTIGTVYRKLGLFEEALPLLEGGLEIRERLLGPDHPAVATSLAPLGNLMSETGDYTRAKSLLERSLAIREAALGPVHLLVARDLNDLANILAQVGDFDRALELYERSLAVKEQLHGPLHAEVVNELNNLGLLLSDLGRFEEARAHLERAVELAEESFGPDHPKLAAALDNLGILHARTAAFDLAEPLFERAIAIAERAFGEDHPDTGRLVVHLGILRAQTGRFDEALPLFERGLEIREASLGPDHPGVANDLLNLGSLRNEMGDPEGALPLFERSLAIREKALGPEHPDVAVTLKNLSAVVSITGDPRDPVPMLERALEIEEVALGPDHPSVAATLMMLAGLRTERGDLKGAEDLLGRALRIREQKLPPQHPALAETLEVYAGLLRQRGRGEEAVELESRARSIREARTAEEGA